MFIIFLAVPGYMFHFIFALNRIRLSSGALVLLSREMLFCSIVVSLPAFAVAISIANCLSDYFNYLPPSFWTPLRLLSSPIVSSDTFNLRGIIWIFVILLFWTLAGCISTLAAIYTSRKVFSKKNDDGGWWIRLLEASGLWDYTSQLLVYGESKSRGLQVDLTHDLEGKTIYSGKAISWVDHGIASGLLLKDVYILRHAAGLREKEYMGVDGQGELKRMLFMKDKIVNIHFRVPKGISVSAAEAILDKLKEEEKSK